jgi:transposase
LRPWPGSVRSQPRLGSTPVTGSNRSGDRQLNRALHTIAQARLRDDPLTRADAARRTAEGRTTREIRQCLKRFIARQLFKLLERYDQPALEILLAA